MIVHGDISPANDEIAKTPTHKGNKVLVEYQIGVVISWSRKIPIAAEKNRTLVPVSGAMINRVMTIARVR